QETQETKNSKSRSLHHFGILRRPPHFEGDLLQPEKAKRGSRRGARPRPDHHHAAERCELAASSHGRKARVPFRETGFRQLLKEKGEAGGSRSVEVRNHRPSACFPQPVKVKVNVYAYKVPSEKI